MRLIATLGVVVLGLGLVAGCGSSDDPDGAESLAATGGKTTAPPELTPVDVDQWFADYAAADAQITTVHALVDQKTTVSGSSAETTHMEVDIDVTSATYAVSMEMMGSDAEVVVADSTAYVRLGSGEPQGLSRTALGLTDAVLNPASAVEREREAVTTIERVGSESEQVGGVETDHYRITYDVARLNEIHGADTTAGTVQAGTVQADTVTADIWLDGEGRPIRYTSTRTVEAEGQTVTQTLGAIYSDYGKAVTIEVPQ